MDDDQDKTLRFDPKAVVANSGVPRRVVSWARAWVSAIVTARLDRAAAAVSLKAVTGTAFTTEDRQIFAAQAQARARYGRGWWRRRNHSCETPHQGTREIARRRRQIERGLLSPVFIEHPQPWREVA